MTSVGNKEQSIKELQEIYDSFKKSKTESRLAPFQFSTINFSEVENYFVNIEELRRDFLGFLNVNISKL